MQLHFLSSTPAALRLNGIYVGTIDGFERRIRLEPSERVFVEIIPAENLQPINFFMDEKFFQSPPPYADVYLSDEGAIVYIREFGVKDIKLNVVYQTRFCGNLITVFSQGGVYLSIECGEYVLKNLPACFAKLSAQEHTLAGRPVLALYGGERLIVISESGAIIYMNAAENAQFGDTFKVSVPFETCTAAKAECEFSYDGAELTMVKGKTVETRPPEESVLHFAFFESALTCGDFAAYLDEELKPKAEHLKKYLGEFVSVTVPPESFYLNHGNIAAAGLVYPKARNLYEIKYFAVEISNGKISNVYPVE